MMINKIENEKIKKASWVSMGVGTSFITIEKANKYIDKLQNESWLGYVPIPKKALSFGAAIATTYLTSILAKEEDRKYVWLGFFITVFFIGTNHLLETGGVGGFGSGGDGNENSSTGDENLTVEQQNEILSDLQKEGVIDEISANPHLRIRVHSDAYLLLGGFSSLSGEIFKNEIITILIRMNNIETLELFYGIDQNQLEVGRRIEELKRIAIKQNKKVTIHDDPFLSWN